MTRRSGKKLILLEKYEKLTPEMKNLIEQKKKALEKTLKYYDKLLLKPTLEPKKKEEQE